MQPDAWIDPRLTRVVVETLESRRLLSSVSFGTATAVADPLPFTQRLIATIGPRNDSNPGNGETDFGDAPDSYGTLFASNGASHIASGPAQLGADRDFDRDGIPTPDADGDDRDNRDDEDGVQFTGGNTIGGTGEVTIQVQGGGLLRGWIDFNQNGRFDRSELIVDANVRGGTQSFGYTIPASGLPGDTFARFRLASGVTSLEPIGQVVSGEVEDYAVRLQGRVSGGEDSDFGDAPRSYGTVLADDGPQHRFNEDFVLGREWDSEKDGQPTADASGDDDFNRDDEDGVLFRTPIVPGESFEIEVGTTTGGVLDAFIDFNGDGDFDDKGDRIVAARTIPAGSTRLTLTAPEDAQLGDSYARFRLHAGTPTGAPLGPTGPGGFGEVEDERVAITAPPPIPTLDFGDAPSSYGTTLAANGARHPLSDSVWLGTGQPDAEADGLPSVNANGDDLDGADDEDGVAFVSSIRPGEFFDVEIETNTGGFVSGWIDYNADGDFLDAGEKIADAVAISPGTRTLSIVAPASAVPGNTYARFRIIGGVTPLSPIGPAAAGEVEDYRINISPPATDFGDAPEGFAGTVWRYPTLRDSGGARHEVDPGFTLGSAIDADPVGQPDLAANGDDDDASPDDEDGVTQQALAPGLPNKVVVEFNNTANRPTGVLDAWYDWNADGDWDDSGEHVVQGLTLVTGVNVVPITPPLDATAGTTFARFRLTEQGVNSPRGDAGVGEVEDYAVEVGPNALGPNTGIIVRPRPDFPAGGQGIGILGADGVNDSVRVVGLRTDNVTSLLVDSLQNPRRTYEVIPTSGAPATLIALGTGTNVADVRPNAFTNLYEIGRPQSYSGTPGATTVSFSNVDSTRISLRDGTDRLRLNFTANNGLPNAANLVLRDSPEVRLDGFSVADETTIRLLEGNSGNASALRVGAAPAGFFGGSGLFVSGDSSLDLNVSALVADQTTGVLEYVRDLVIDGHNGGTWDGPGIRSSLIASDARLGVGYGRADRVFADERLGLTLGDDDVIVSAALLGDANMDGTVNLVDFGRLRGGFGTTTGSLWSEGDFTYDGNVNLADFGRLRGNFGEMF
jgi:hypothetical protein